MKKALLVTGVAAVVGLASVGGVVSAATPSDAKATGEVAATQHGSSLIDKLATRFSLDKNEVQEVFEEHHKDMHKNMQPKIEEKLSRAVEAGYITEAQKTAILDKYEELKNYQESIKDKPLEERRELLKAKHEELRKWAEENGLTKFAHFLGGFAHGEHKMMIKGDKEASLGIH